MIGKDEAQRICQAVADKLAKVPGVDDDTISVSAKRVKKVHRESLSDAQKAASRHGGFDFNAEFKLEGVPVLVRESFFIPAGANEGDYDLDAIVRFLVEV